MSSHNTTSSGTDEGDAEKEEQGGVQLSRPINHNNNNNLNYNDDEDNGSDDGDIDEDDGGLGPRLVPYNTDATASAQVDEDKPLLLEAPKGGQQLKGSNWNSKLSARQRSRRIRTASLLCLFVCAFCLTMSLAVVFAISAFVSHYYIDWIINEGVRGRIVLDPLISGDGFRRWEANTWNDSAPRYEYITMFNLTNPHDVVDRGAIPQYNEVGPYVFRKWIHRFNLTWTRDRDVIFFKQRDWYIFDRNMTNSSLSSGDIIYNLNPSYAGVMMSAGNESMLMRNMISGEINGILNFLTTDFLSDAESAWRPLVLASQAAVCISTTSLQSFYLSWSDDFSPPNKEYEAMLLSQGYTTPTNIDPSTSARLLASTGEPYSLLNLNASSVWDSACLHSNISVAEMLKSTFLLTDFQLKRICNWLPVFEHRWILPYLQNTHGISSLSDLGWLQWGTGRGTPFSESAKDEHANFPGYPEYYYFLKNVYRPDNLSHVEMDLMSSKLLLRDGRYPMSDSRNMATFSLLLDRADYVNIELNWPEFDSPEQIRAFGEYLGYVMRNFVNQTLQQSFAKDIGIVSRRSVTEWIFSYDDPFLEMLNKSDAAVHSVLIRNDTSLDSACDRQGRSAMITGRYNVSLVSELVAYDGMTDLHYWKVPTQVQGTLGETFSPRLGSNDSITLWFPQLFREQVFLPESTVELLGISLQRFRLAPFMLLPNDVYFNRWHSIANVSLSGCPFFISKPHFFGSESYWATRLHGMKDPNDTEDNTFLDVEPITGLTMNEGKRIQVNLYIPNDTLWFDVYHRSTPTGMLYPIAAIDERSTLTQDEATEFHDTVITGMFLRWWSFVGAVAAAVACLALALVALVSIVGTVIQMFGASW